MKPEPRMQPIGVVVALPNKDLKLVNLDCLLAYLQGTCQKHRRPVFLAFSIIQNFTFDNLFSVFYNKFLQHLTHFLFCFSQHAEL